MLIYSHIGIVGEVGTVAVDTERETGVGWTRSKSLS